ncbi:hypothetical protein JHK86_022649 [Glycine max]|nr:hypothetical protein JHK86_022649 [Glycine max]
MRRDAILAMQHENVVRPSVFDRIREGPPLGFEKKMSIKDQEEKEMITDFFEYGFEDSLEAICGVSMESNGKGVSIDGVPLPFEAGEIDVDDYEEPHARGHGNTTL